MTGNKKRYLPISELCISEPNTCLIKNAMIRQQVLTKKVIDIDRATIFIASSSFSGSIIADSYRPVINTHIICDILKYNANNPKSEGVKRRVKTGDIATGIACAIIVPVIRIITFFENELPLKSLIVIVNQDNSIGRFERETGIN